MWRPDGWRNPWKEDMPTFLLDTAESIRQAEEGYRIRTEAYEAGADAMLKAIRHVATDSHLWLEHFRAIWTKDVEDEVSPS